MLAVGCGGKRAVSAALQPLLRISLCPHQVVAVLGLAGVCVWIRKSSNELKAYSHQWTHVPWGCARPSLWTTLTRALITRDLGQCHVVGESHKGSDGRGL